MIALLLLAALTHAAGEMIIVLISRAAFFWFDVVILLAFAVAFDVAVFGAALAAATVLLGPRRVASLASDAIVRRRSFLVAAWAAYLGASLLLLRHVVTSTTGVVAFLAIVLLSGVALLRTWSRVDSAGVLSVGLLGLALANVGGVGWATLATEESPLVGDSTHLRLVSFGWMFLPATVVVVSLLWRPRILQRCTIRRSIATLASLLAVGAAGIAWGHHLAQRSSVRWPTSAMRRDAALRPNVVLIVLDTVSARHMDLFQNAGPPTMPRITRFAREHCDLVTTIMAPAPWTPATHASIFSGTWPHVHGCRRPTPAEAGESITNPYYCMDMREDLPTLAEWLSDRGYHCGAVVGNSILNYYGLPRGFRHFDGQSPKFVSWTRHMLFHIPRVRRVLMCVPAPLRAGLSLFDPLSPEWRTADRISREALEWASRNDSEPYFLFVNYIDAHTPYRPESAAKRLSRLPDEYLELSNRLWEAYDARNEPLPTDLVAGLSSLYDDALRELDQSVGAFLDSLSTEPNFANTLLIITSDHGEEFMEHGQLEHSTDVYEPQVRTPLLVRFPKALRERPPHVDPGFQQVDLFATIASVVGGGELPETDGRPWGDGRGYALSEVFQNPEFSPRYRFGYCAIEMDGYKYIRRSDGAEELYDLGRDPGESRNAVETRPDLVARCRRLVAQRDERLMRGGRPAESSAGERLEQLKSLGYVH